MTREEIKKAIDDVLDIKATDNYSMSVGVITKKGSTDSIEAVVYRMQSGFIIKSLEYRTFCTDEFFTEWLNYWKEIFSAERSAKDDTD